MPRPKKTTPTIATTEPDTNLNPDRAQVAAVADLPHAPEPAPVTSVFRVMREVPTSGDSLRDYLRMSADPTVSPNVGGEYFRRMSKEDQVLANVFVERICASEAKMVDPILAAKDERIALMDVERANHRKEIEMWMGAVQKVTAERDEMAARIAELEAEVATSPTNDDPLLESVDAPTLRKMVFHWMNEAATGSTLRAYLRALTYPASVAENLKMARGRLTDEDRALVHSLTEDEVGLRDYLRVAANPDVTPATIDAHYRRLSQADSEVVTRYCVAIAADAIRTYAESHAPTPADLIAGYRAVASGQVKAAEWKGRCLVRLHGNPEPIAMYDHPEPPPGCMPSGFVAEVASGTTRIMSPPLKDEAEARAWCEARCGWTVVQ